MADIEGAVEEVLSAVGAEFKRKHALKALQKSGGDIEEAVALLLEQDSSSSSSAEDSPEAPSAHPSPSPSRSTINTENVTQEVDQVPRTREFVEERTEMAIDANSAFTVPYPVALDGSEVGELLGNTMDLSGNVQRAQQLAAAFASIEEALSRLVLTSGGPESNIQVFDFKTKSPDEVAREKRRNRLDNSRKTERKKKPRNKRPPIMKDLDRTTTTSAKAPRRERSREREVRLELERDRARELDMIGIHDDADLGRTKIKSTEYKRDEPKDEKAKMAGIKSRKKNRNSKMNRRKRNIR